MASRTLVLLLVTSAIIAGCVTPGQDPGPDGKGGTTGNAALANDAEAIVFRTGDNLSGRIAADVKAKSFLIGHDAGEPTVAITSDGTMFYAAATFDNLCVPPNPAASTCLPRTDILRSMDQGKTWEDVTPMLPGGVLRAHPETGDPMVYVDPATDRVFDIDQRAAVGGYTVSYTDDLGESWMVQSTACDAPPCDHQTIVASTPRLVTTVGYPNVILVCYNQIHSTACQRSLTGGTAFQRATPPFEGVDATKTGPQTTEDLSGVCSGLVGHLKASVDGVIYLPKEHCGAALIATTMDDGTTWNVVRVSERPIIGPDPVVAIDADGTVYYVFLSDDAHLYLATSSDQGATWSEALDVTPPGLTAVHLPAIVAGDMGRVAMAFVGTDDPEGFEQEEETPNATWHGYISVLTGAQTPEISITTARVNPLDDPLVRGTCGPGRCPGLTDFIDIQVDAEGRPWAAFVDACVEACVTDPASGNDGAAGFVATLSQGPGLFAASVALPGLRA